MRIVVFGDSSKKAFTNKVWPDVLQIGMNTARRALAVSDSIDDQPRTKSDVAAGKNARCSRHQRFFVYGQSATRCYLQPIFRLHPAQLASLPDGDDDTVAFPHFFTVREK